MSYTDHQVGLFFATLPSSAFLSLHYANPALGGLGAAEFTGGSYVRQPLSLSVVSQRAIHNTNAILFTGLPASTVAYLGIWDAVAAGILRAYIPVLPTAAVVSGGQFPVSVGDLALTF